MRDIMEYVEDLAQLHSELWALFPGMKNVLDPNRFEEHLFDDVLRHRFYEKLSEYARKLKVALSSELWTEKTSPEKVEMYKKDLKFFVELRQSVKLRYSDGIDIRQYEPQIQKLIDTHITTDGETIITGKVYNIFDHEERQELMEEMGSYGAQADAIASQTIRHITDRYDEDPVYYKRLGELIRETIQSYHEKRISEKEFLEQAFHYEQQAKTGGESEVPVAVRSKPEVVPFYHLATEVFSNINGQADGELAVPVAVLTEEAIRDVVTVNGDIIVDWQLDPDMPGRIRNRVDGVLLEVERTYKHRFDNDELDMYLDQVIRVAKSRFKK